MLKQLCIGRFCLRNLQSMPIITAHNWGRVAQQLCGKLDQICFHLDNARSHVAKRTSQKILELGWRVLSHPPYSPDLAATDYHLFLALSNHLNNFEELRRRTSKNFGEELRRRNPTQ